MWGEKLRFGQGTSLRNCLQKCKTKHYHRDNLQYVGPYACLNLYCVVIGNQQWRGVWEVFQSDVPLPLPLPVGSLWSKDATFHMELIDNLCFRFTKLFLYINKHHLDVITNLWKFFLYFKLSQNTTNYIKYAYRQTEMTIERNY